MKGVEVVEVWSLELLTFRVLETSFAFYLTLAFTLKASKFRRLIGTMSPPSDDDTATIYVEGKRKMVDGFVRWCQKGSAKVGLSQKLELVETADEVPTGLYDGFYVKMEEDSE